MPYRLLTESGCIGWETGLAVWTRAFANPDLLPWLFAQRR